MKFLSPNSKLHPKYDQLNVLTNQKANLWKLNLPMFFLNTERTF